MTRAFLAIPASDPHARAWALERAREMGWTDIRTEAWLYIVGEVPLSTWPATPFKVNTMTADVVIYQADRITPWQARLGGIVPVGYPMDVWLVANFAGVEWLQVSVNPELWTRGDHTALMLV